MTATPAGQDEDLVLVLHQFRITHFPVGLLVYLGLPGIHRRKGIAADGWRPGEIEGLDAVGSLPVPVGKRASKDLDGRVTVAVGAVVILNDGVELDGGSFSDPAERVDIDVQGTGAQHQHVDQAFPGPGLHVDAVKVAALDPVAQSHGQQKGPATLPGKRLQHGSNRAHELCQMLAIFPLTANRQQQRTALHVQLDTVKFIVLGCLAQHAQLVVSHRLEGKVEQDHLMKRGVIRPGANGPFGVLLLDGNRGGGSKVRVSCVEAVGKEGFQTSLSGRLQIKAHDIDALIHPAPVLFAIV